MANDLSAVVPQLLAMGLVALRENARTAMIVNRGYEAQAGGQGSTVEVTIPSAIQAQQVTPGSTPQGGQDLTPTKVNIALDQWYEAPFVLTDKELLEVANGTMPMVASEAVKSVINVVDADILSQFSKFFGYVPKSAGGIFKDASGNPTQQTAVDARTALSNQLAPPDPRWLVMDPTAVGEALMVQSLTESTFTGDVQAIRDGSFQRRLGFGWLENQNIQNHVGGDMASRLVNDAGATLALGDKTVPVDGGTGTGAIGDIIRFAGDTQNYVLTAAESGGNLQIEPGLQAVPADNAAITVQTSGTEIMNGGFHRDCIALATRPLARSAHPGAIIQSMVDPISGLTLRLEVTRQHKQDRFSFDILWGCQVIRRELGVRIEG